MKLDYAGSAAQVRNFLETLPPRKNKRVQASREFWIKFLTREPTSQREWDIARTKAKNWELCACGTSLPRELRVNGEINGEPADPELERLGYRFWCAVNRRQWEDAKISFMVIHNREVELLRALEIDNPEFN